MKPLYCHIIFLLTIASFCGCNQKDADSIAKLKEINRRLEDEFYTIKETERISLEIYRRTLKYSRTSFDNRQVFWGKDSINTFPLYELASNPRLVFCFSTNTCTPCIDSAIELIKERYTDFEHNETVIIAGDYPLRLRDNCYRKRMLGGIELPVAEIEAPFLTPLAGVYPVCFSRDSELSAMPLLWFKLRNNNVLCSSSNLTRMMTIDIPNFLVRKNTFFVVNAVVQAMLEANTQNYWDINAWKRVVEGYNADENSQYTRNIEVCPVIVDPHNEYPQSDTLIVPLTFTIMFTPVGGTVKYWNFHFGQPNMEPAWEDTLPTPYNRTIEFQCNHEFEFSGSNLTYMKRPLLNNGMNQTFENDFGTPSLWCRFPETMGRLQINIGVDFGYWSDKSFTDIIVNALDFGLIEQIDLSKPEEMDFSQKDIIYSNTNNQEPDTDETFYIYSYNDNYGSGQLYLQNNNNLVDTLTYSYGQDKPEWNYVGIMSQFFNRQQINNDVVKINDLFIAYDDRFVNNMEIRPTTGEVNVTTVKPKTYNITKVI